MDKVNNLKQWQQQQKLFSQDDRKFEHKFKSIDQNKEKEKFKEFHWQKCYNDSYSSNPDEKIEKENINPDKQMASLPVLSLDDLPVGGIIKNFTDLLNDKLESSNPEENNEAIDKPKRQFLKKGQGLARFKPGTKFIINRKNSDKSCLNQKKPINSQKTQTVNKKPLASINKNVKPTSTLVKLKMDSKDSKNDSLRMFEKLEEQTSHDSFNSNSALMTCIKSNKNSDSYFDTSVQNLSELEKKIEFLSISQKDQLSKPITINSNSKSDPSINQKEIKTNKNRKTFLIKHKESDNKVPDIESDNDILPYGTDIEEAISIKNRVRFSDQEKQFDDEEEWLEQSKIEQSHDSLTNSNNNLKHQEYNQINYQLEKKSILKEFQQISNEKGDNLHKNQQSLAYFEPSLLKHSLQELQKEIEMFRSENEQLNKIKRDMEKDQVSLKKEKRELEKKISEERKSFEETLKQERAKLLKERKIWENLKERNLELETNSNQEIEELKQQIKLLQEEKSKKNEKESTVLVKSRERIRTLERENELLKDETEQLKNRISQLESIKRSKPKSNTKSIHLINDEISHKSNPVENKEVSSLTKRKPEPKGSSLKKQDTNIKITKNKNENIKESSKEIVKETDVYELLNEKNDDDLESSSLKENEPSIEVRNNKRIKTWPDGRKEIIYSNKNLKKISADGNIEKLIYVNGDVKEVNKSTGVSKYFYSLNKVYETTYPDELQILEFPSGQVEKRWPNGKTEITLSDGTIKICESDGSQRVMLPDGSLVVYENGIKTLSFPNGQKEIHTKDHKRREYPDGTIKYLYENGTLETRYADGRIKIRDASGNIIKMIN